MIIVLIISVLITVVLHEFAHLISAKMVNCKVKIFSIGFGKKLLSFNYKGTRYQLALIPLGGYNELENELECSRDKTTLPNLSYSKKLIVILSGCVINLITGGIAYYYGIQIPNYNLYYFGMISMILGLMNLLPVPALDGGFPFLFLLEKVIPKKYALQLIRFLVKWGFRFLTLVNILCLPWLIMNWRKL